MTPRWHMLICLSCASQVHHGRLWEVLPQALSGRELSEVQGAGCRGWALGACLLHLVRCIQDPDSYSRAHFWSSLWPFGLLRTLLSS